MPKVTVVTLPNEELQMPEMPKTRPVKKIQLSIPFSVMKNLLVPLIGREYLLLNALAFLLGRLSIMGELAPFGLAFFAATAQVIRSRAWPVAMWAMTGVVSSGHYQEAGVYALTILAYYRMADKLNRLQRKVLAVPLFLFGSVVLAGLALNVWQGTLYNVVQVLFEGVMCMVLSFTFVYGVPLLINPAGRRQVSGEALICTMVLLATGVAGLGNITVWGYGLRNIAGSVLVMVLAWGGGAGIGASVGVVMGLVAGLTDGNAPQAIALYSLAGLLSGMMRPLGKFAVMLGFISGSAVTALYFGQAADLLQVITEAALAAVAVALIPASKVMVWSEYAQQEERETVDSDAFVAAAENKLKNIADIFGDLAGAFGHISSEAREKMREEELARMLSTVGEQVCGACSRRNACWDKDFYHTYQLMVDMLARAEVANLTIASMALPLRDHCIMRKELVDAINLVAERNRTYSFWQKKLGDSRQMVTEQMKATSTIIGNLALEIKKEPRSDRETARLIKEKAAIIECPVDDVRVTGGRGAVAVTLCKKPCSGTRECLNTLLPLTAGLLQEKMTIHAQCGNQGTKKCKLDMQVADRYVVETGMAVCAKQADGICGDTCAVVPLNRGKVALMLSDGMGSGSQAAGESVMAVKFLERLLTVGFEVDVAVKTVNSLLMLRMPDETFATIDMVIIDTYSGETEFLKIGSAPSFVKRVREVATIKSASLPIGILHQIEIEPVHYELVPGDIVVMVSDGIIDAPNRVPDRENWVANYLRKIDSASVQDIADNLLRQAVSLTGGPQKDDMSILVAKIMKRPEVLH